jgi:hypothetical protein
MHTPADAAARQCELPGALEEPEVRLRTAEEGAMQRQHA